MKNNDDIKPKAYFSVITPRNRYETHRRMRDMSILPGDIISYDHGLYSMVMRVQRVNEKGIPVQNCLIRTTGKNFE
jgi:hypothetical protein